MAELKYKDITEKIIGASFEVHKFLGNGFQEVIYQRAMAWELTQAGVSEFVIQKPIGWVKTNMNSMFAAFYKNGGTPYSRQIRNSIPDLSIFLYL